MFPGKRSSETTWILAPCFANGESAEQISQTRQSHAQIHIMYYT